MIAIQVSKLFSIQFVYFSKKLNSFIVYNFFGNNKFLCQIKNYNNETKNEWIKYSKHIWHNNKIIKVYL